MRIGEFTNSAKNHVMTTIPKVTTGKHNNLVFIRDYAQHITLQVGKHSLTAIYKQNIIGGHKETFLIEADTMQQMEERIDNYKNIAQERMDEAMVRFAKQFRLYLPFEKITWQRAENWIKGDEYVDKIPKEVIIHDTVFKKVYGEGIEILTGKGQDATATTKQFFKNRCIEDFSPQIAEAIKDIVQTFEDSALKPLTAQIELHLEVQRETLQTLKRMQQTMDEKKVRDVDDAYFKAFRHYRW